MLQVEPLLTSFLSGCEVYLVVDTEAEGELNDTKKGGGAVDCATDMTDAVTNVKVEVKAGVKVEAEARA